MIPGSRAREGAGIFFIFEHGLFFHSQILDKQNNGWHGLNGLICSYVTLSVSTTDDTD
jgi:hypothetical protein